MAAPAQKIALQFTFEGRPLDWGRYFQAFEMRKSISEKASQAVFTFLGVPMDLVAKSSLRANKNLEFRWGNPPNMSIPHNYVIHGIDQSYEGDTSIVRLNLIDNRVQLQANSAFSAYPHKSFSEIVKDVARDLQEPASGSGGRGQAPDRLRPEATIGPFCRPCSVKSQFQR